MFSGTQFYKTLRDEILIKYDTTEEETAMISVTLNIYTHLKYEDVEKEVDRITEDGKKEASVVNE